MSPESYERFRKVDLILLAKDGLQLTSSPVPICGHPTLPLHLRTHQNIRCPVL